MVERCSSNQRWMDASEKAQVAGLDFTVTTLVGSSLARAARSSSACSTFCTTAPPWIAGATAVFFCSPRQPFSSSIETRHLAAAAFAALLESFLMASPPSLYHSCRRRSSAGVANLFR